MNNEYTKRRDILRRVRQYKNLPKYDLGTQPINSGYQYSEDYIPTGSVDKVATSANRSIQAQKQQNAANTINRGIQTGKLIYDLLPSALNSNAALAASNNALSSAFVGSLTPTTINTSLGTASTAGINSSIASSQSAAGVAGGATGVGASVVSKAIPVIGALTSGYNLINDMKGFDDYTNEHDIQDMSGKTTQSIRGVNYDTYSGFDQKGIKDLTKAQNVGSTINTTLSGAGLGASIGSFLGPLGTGIGAGIGALGGFIGGLFGSHSRKERVKRAIANMKDAQSRYNLQSESNAASKGLRNEFYSKHAGTGSSGMYSADGGKSKGGVMNGDVEPNGIAPVYTPNGVQMGPVNSLVGKGETIADLDRGSATLVTTGKKRVDDQPSVAQNGDNITIFGNKIDPMTGISFADLVAPLTMQMQRLNKISSKISGDSNTRKVQEREIQKAKAPILNQMRGIAERQKQTQQQSVQRYDVGKSDIYSILPGLLGANTAMNQYYSYKKDRPSTYNTYTPNINAESAFKLLGGRFDPTTQLNSLNDVTRQAMYNINQSPYSSGQRLGMMSQLFNDRMKNAASIYSNAENVNNQYRQELAKSMLAEGQSDATRRQQANALAYDNYAKALATRRKGMETGLAGALGSINNMFSNLSNNYWINKNIGLYNQKLGKDQLALLSQIR